MARTLSGLVLTYDREPCSRMLTIVGSVGCVSVRPGLRHHEVSDPDNRLKSSVPTIARGAGHAGSGFLAFGDAFLGRMAEQDRERNLAIASTMNRNVGSLPGRLARRGGPFLSRRRDRPKVCMDGIGDKPRSRKYS